MIAAQIQQTEGPSPELAACIAEYHRALDICSGYPLDHERQIFDATNKAIEAVPHYTTERTYHAKAGRNYRLSTANTHSVAMARDFLGRGWCEGDFLDCCRELVEAADRRDAEIAEILSRPDRAKVRQRHDEINAAFGDAYDAVVLFPVRTLADLKCKLAFFEEDGEVKISIKTLLADLDRIAQADD